MLHKSFTCWTAAAGALVARLPAIASDRPTWLASLASLASPRILGWPRASRQRAICWLVRLLSTLMSNQADEQATVHSLLRNSIAMAFRGTCKCAITEGRYLHVHQQ